MDQRLTPIVAGGSTTILGLFSSQIATFISHTEIVQLATVAISGFFGLATTLASIWLAHYLRQRGEKTKVSVDTDQTKVTVETEQNKQD